MSDEWQPPRCRHGHIILGCPDDDCPEQNWYLNAQDGILRDWHERQQAEARRIVRDLLGLKENHA